MDFWKKVNISYFFEKVFLNGYKYVNYMYVYVIIREKKWKDD